MVGNGKGPGSFNPELHPIWIVSRDEDSTLGGFDGRIGPIGKGSPITQGNGQGGYRPQGGVALLFNRGTRPDAAAVRALAEGTGAFGISHDPATAPTAGDDETAGNWLELLINGLSFDLLGLAGGAAAELPALRHRFGLGAMPERAEAILLAAGPHLAGGEAMMPVVRSQLALGMRLAVMPEVAAVAWLPAQSVMDADYFTSVVTAWLEGGAFPALGLTAFTVALDGGLQSEGLGFFTGQELRIEPELAEDRTAATRLAVRLINELVGYGQVDGRFEMTGPDGDPLMLEPSANNAFVRVRPGR